jgi:ATP-dependent helicase/nuclease subunit A
LLEHLPTLPKERWATAAEAFISGRGRQLAAAVRKGIVTETLAILRDPAFAALFGPEARAEVAIVAEVPHPSGRGPALRLAGKIDRLVRDLDSILIVDYKTNRPPPTKVEQVAAAYLFQLAAYRLALREIYAGRRVKTALLWTDGPRIMPIPDLLLDEFTGRLWSLDVSHLDASGAHS